IISMASRKSARPPAALRTMRRFMPLSVPRARVPARPAVSSRASAGDWEGFEVPAEYGLGHAGLQPAVYGRCIHAAEIGGMAQIVGFIEIGQVRSTAVMATAHTLAGQEHD